MEKKTVKGEMKYLLSKIAFGIKSLFKKPIKLSNFFVVIAGIVHLIISTIQINTINTLSNQECGVVLFMFILVGLAAVFNATRFKEAKGPRVIFVVAVLAVVIGFGVWLLAIYFNAYTNQANANKGQIMKGVIVSILMLACYFVGVVGALWAYIKRKKALSA